MKIYRSVTIDIDSGEVLSEDSFEYEGELALCGGDGGGDGGGGDSGGGMGDADAVGGIGPGDSGGFGIGASGEGGVGVGASGSGSVGDSGGFGIGASGSGGIGAGGSASGSVGGGGSTGFGMGVGDTSSFGLGDLGNVFGASEVFGAPAEAFGTFGQNTSSQADLDAAVAAAALEALGNVFGARGVTMESPEPNPNQLGYMTNTPFDNPVYAAQIDQALANYASNRAHNIDAMNVFSALLSPSMMSLTAVPTVANYATQPNPATATPSNFSILGSILGMLGMNTTPTEAVVNAFQPETPTETEIASWWSPEGNFIGFVPAAPPTFSQGESEDDDTGNNTWGP